MKKIRIHIETKYDCMDNALFVIAQFPSIPSIGDKVHLSKEMILDLEIGVYSDVELVKKYIPEWICKDSVIDFHNVMNINFSFDLAVIVSGICYHKDLDIIDIQLTKQE